MNERDWKAATAPDALLVLLRAGGRASERKLRLLACACASQLLPLAKVLSEVTRSALEEVLRYADGTTTKTAMKRLRKELDRARGTTPLRRDTADDFVCYAIEYASTEKQYLRAIGYSTAVLDNWGRGLVFCPQVQLLRDIFGNPFRSLPAIDPAWHSWNDRTVAKLAEGVYEQRRIEDLPILADALEDAGCANPVLLEHLRGPGPHVRGCWATDLLTGRK